ncbi:ABC transporter permease [Microlunatus sp. GCM10028923]|uniref:ABC transporter permease n=1 Tax=Microlunatus sp. GCM10028923 TaxID=3273400 RepID=UPI00361881BE
MIIPTGTGRLVRFILRRDRWFLPLWIAVPPLILLSFAGAMATSFPTAEVREQYAEASASNAMFTMMYGELHGAGLGELVAWRAGFFPVLLGLCSMLSVIRHTRAEEEAGRRELIAATAISRHASLAAALIVVSAVNLSIGLLTALALISFGLPAVGSIALASGLAGCGVGLAGVAALIAQLTSGAGTARGIGIVFLAAALMLRSVGDLNTQAGGALGWVMWLSPFGWSNQLRPFAGERWWLLVLVLLVSAALTALAIVVSGRRDLGAGLIQPRPGPAVAAPGLRSPVALAWRLHRRTLAGWSLGLALAGLAFGSIGRTGEQIASTMSPEAMAALAGVLSGAGSLGDQFLAVILEMFSMIAAGYAVLATLAIMNEERSGRAEELLATPVNRIRWAASHLLFALINPTVVTVVFGTAVGLVHGLSGDDPGDQLLRVFGGTVARLPVIWLFVGLTFLLCGLLPRIAAGAFVVLFGSLLILGLGIQLRLSPWIVGLSPFAHLPELPGGELQWTPLVVLTALTAILIAAGLVGLRRRDLPAA